MENYTLKSRPVQCRNGKWADTVSGRRLKEADAENGKIVFWANEPNCTQNRKSRQYVHGRLREELCTFIINLEGDHVIFGVWCADKLGKHGLRWKCVLRACFFRNAEPQFPQGNIGKLRYWLYSGCQRLDDTLLERNPQAMPINLVFARAWGCADSPSFHESPIILLRKWLDGELCKDLSIMPSIVSQLRETPLKAREKPSILNRYRYGIEVEFTGIPRQEAAHVVAAALHGKLLYLWSHYEITDPQDLVWIIKDDSSIHPEGYGKQHPDTFRCELSTPVFDSARDMKKLEAVLRALSKSGAKCNRTTGAHVHVDGNYSKYDLSILAQIVYQRDALIKRMVRMYQSRREYCEEMSPYTAEKLMFSRYRDDLLEDPDFSRYRTLNVCSYWEGKGVEFRCFNSSLNPKLIQDYVIFSLGICSMVRSRYKFYRPRRGDDMAVLKNWLGHMDLSEEECDELFSLFQRNLLKAQNDSCKKRHVAHVARC